jgi:hypothetical protein
MAVYTACVTAGVSDLEHATSKTTIPMMPEKIRGIFRIGLFFYETAGKD